MLNVCGIYIYIPSGPQVSASGGVGWGMLASCSCYVDATLMGGVWDQACSPPARFGIKPRGNFEKENLAAGWWSWSNNEQKRADYQHVPFMLTLKFTANTDKKRHLFILPREPQQKMTIPDKKNQRNSWNVVFRVGKHENQNWHVLWITCHNMQLARAQKFGSVQLSLKNEEECEKSAFRCGETVIFDIWINDKQDNLRKTRAPSVYIYI